MDLFGINVPLPESVSGVASNTFQVLAYSFVFVLFCGLLTYFYFMFIRYNKKVEIYENLGGNQYRRIGTDRARLKKIGDSGEEVLVLRKRKKVLSAYGRKMGANLYWFAIGQDGYWYNITLGDLDAKRGMLDIEPVDRDIRYAQTAIRRNIIDRYRKISFMDRYGSWIIGGVTLMIVFAGLYFLVDKMGETAGALSESVKVGERVLDRVEDLLSTMDSLQTASGLQPVQVVG